MNNNKKLGLILIIIGILLSIVLLQLIAGLNVESEELGCFEEDECAQIESTLSLTHIVFGVVGFIFALGIYLIFFSKGEESILKRLEENKVKEWKDKKFEWILKGLDEFEKKVMNSIKEQQGITQSTLRIRTNMSKAKLSYVIRDLEKKNLIRRIKKGKTFSIYLKDKF
tara:strand:+ start:348 stop:854 length:507 start_codon:yes stop_codon:yes gene_type:complete